MNSNVYLKFFIYFFAIKDYIDIDMDYLDIKRDDKIAKIPNVDIVDCN